MCFDPALKEYQCSEGETQVELVTTWYSVCTRVRTGTWYRSILSVCIRRALT